MAAGLGAERRRALRHSNLSFMMALVSILTQRWFIRALTGGLSKCLRAGSVPGWISPSLPPPQGHPAPQVPWPERGWDHLAAACRHGALGPHSPPQSSLPGDTQLQPLAGDLLLPPRGHVGLSPPSGRVGHTRRSALPELPVPLSVVT